MIKKFLSKLKKLLKQGTSPQALKKSLSFGVVFSLVPLPWASTLLISFIGLRMKWNVPLLLMLSYLLFPFQVLFMLPYLNLGRWMHRLEPFVIEAEFIQKGIEKGAFSLVGELGINVWYALAGWMVSGIFIYWISLQLLGLLFKHKSPAANP